MRKKQTTNQNILRNIFKISVAKFETVQRTNLHKILILKTNHSALWSPVTYSMLRLISAAYAILNAQSIPWATGYVTD